MKSFSFRVGDDPKVYELCFSTNALKRLQDLVGMPVAQYFNSIVHTGTDGTSTLNLSAVDVQNLLWCGLEGARLRSKMLRASKPFEIYDIGDLVDRIDEEHRGQVYDIQAGELVPFGLYIMNSFLDSRERQAQSTFEALQEEEAKARAEQGLPPNEPTEEQKAEARRLDPTPPGTGAA